MTPADHARNNAISLEAKKDRMAQRQSNDWAVTFTVQGIDIDARLTQAPVGTRYAMVLVEIGEDEQPVNRKEAMQPDANRSKTGAMAAPVDARPQPAQLQAGAKRPWRDIPFSQQAGILINSPAFAAYLREEHQDEWHETGETDACLKFICKIDSKSELMTNHKAAALWHQIDTHYWAWLAKERVGA